MPDQGFEQMDVNSTASYNIAKSSAGYGLVPIQYGQIGSRPDLQYETAPALANVGEAVFANNSFDTSSVGTRDVHFSPAQYMSINRVLEQNIDPQLFAIN